MEDESVYALRFPKYRRRSAILFSIKTLIEKDGDFAKFSAYTLSYSMKSHSAGISLKIYRRVEDFSH